MKGFLLALIVIVFGIFVFYSAFRGMVLLFLLPVLIALTALWYVVSFLVTRKMVVKARGVDDFWYHRCSYVKPGGEDMVSGALAVTEQEIVFYARKSGKGGVVPVWSCFTPELESYNLGKVDEHHKGIELALSGGLSGVKFVTSKLQGQEGDFRKAIGWE